MGEHTMRVGVYQMRRQPRPAMTPKQPLPGSTHPWSILVAAALLCLAALWNGQPFFYPDTPTYLRGAEMGVTKVVGSGRLKPWLPAQSTQPVAATTPAADAPKAVTPAKSLTSVDDKIVLAGRSVYYGALLYASYLAGSMWLTVAVQALCVAYLLHLLMVRRWGLRPLHLLGTVAALGLVTPLAVYTGLLMPDVFAGLGILSAGTLAVYWKRLGRADRAALTAMLLFGLTAHASHVAVMALMLLVGLAARRFSVRWRHLSGAALLVVAACMVGAVGAEWAFGKAVTKAVGSPPLRLPHPMARLIDMGPGTDYLRQNCPQAGFAACAFLQNYPTAWDDFLFSTDPHKGVFALADAATKRQLSQEQMRFVVEVVRHDPVGVVRGVGSEVVRQFGQFGMDVWGYGPRELAMYAGRIPDAMFARMQASRAVGTDVYARWFTLAAYASTVASLVLAAWLLRRHRDGHRAVDPAPDGFIDMAWIGLAGVAANAVICATLASSLDRFQARVIWIVPFLAFSAFALLLSHRRAAASAAVASTNAPLQGSAS